MDDRELVEALKNREDGALDALYTAFGPLLRYIIAPILFDLSDREECLSDVLMQVWQSIGGTGWSLPPCPLGWRRWPGTPR